MKDFGSLGFSFLFKLCMNMKFFGVLSCSFIFIIDRFSFFLYMNEQDFGSYDISGFWMDFISFS